MALRDPDKTRNNLLEIASCLFQQKGYNGTSLTDIISKANVSKGALYHHFSNKQDLLYAIIDELFKEQSKAHWESITSASDPIEAIAKSIEKQAIDASQEDMCNGCPIHNLLAELGSTNDGLRMRVDAIFCAVQKSIYEAFERAKVLNIVSDSTDSKRVAMLIMCTMNGMPQMVTSCQNRDVFKEISAALSDYIRSFKIVD
ncbi:TetR/AcrR family transcriptional regulator [Psychrosphaera haliotis]|uniref:TetR family transcriptional regulator n=1 Tax=Psychrosphaera haliotis TaxID=555083 RepID=A0A6N8F858_9GAMM|nr:TetR/AcrR family transcriptional regulator [Psychrosphaera haliotis]MUH71599.1 TetR family transcriptional regulator [Psychrosphaera haliotis]